MCNFAKLGLEPGVLSWDDVASIDGEDKVGEEIKVWNLILAFRRDEVRKPETLLLKLVCAAVHNCGCNSLLGGNEDASNKWTTCAGFEVRTFAYKENGDVCLRTLGKSI